MKYRVMFLFHNFLWSSDVVLEQEEPLAKIGLSLVESELELFASSYRTSIGA